MLRKFSWNFRASPVAIVTLRKTTTSDRTFEFQTVSASRAPDSPAPAGHDASRRGPERAFFFVPGIVGLLVNDGDPEGGKTAGKIAVNRSAG